MQLMKLLKQQLITVPCSAHSLRYGRIQLLLHVTSCVADKSCMVLESVPSGAKQRNLHTCQGTDARNTFIGALQQARFQ
jgi:hypothetical protein